MSFVALGADQDTSAVVFAGAGFQRPRLVKPEPTRTARRAAAAPKRQRDSYWGVASWYGRYAVSSGANATHHPQLLGRDGNIRYRMLPGAFRESMRAAKAGDREIKLLVNHNKRAVLAGTADKSLLLWSDGSSLRFAIDPNTDRGREALRYVKRNPDMREVSIGGHYSPSHMSPITKGFSLCAMFDLEEISLVRNGNAGCPGTWLKPCLLTE